MHLPSKTFHTALLFLCLSCMHTPRSDYANLGIQNSTKTAYSKKAMVVAAHPLAAEAGLSMLKAGGNAVDAAVATSFAISVLRPQSTGIGGGGFLLYHDAKEHKNYVFDFRERAPILATRDMYLNEKGEVRDFLYLGNHIPLASENGHLSVGTPGLVAGLVQVHERFGKLPLRTVIAPAISLAEGGFEVYPGLSEDIHERADVMKHFPATRKIFFSPHGKPLEAGSWLVQKDLGRTLRLIAENGRAGFYSGEIKDKLLAEMQRGGGILQDADLTDYTVKEPKALVGHYRGHEIVTMPLPSSGGVHILQMLNMLETTDPLSGQPTLGSVHLLAEVMKRAFADRATYLGDSEFSNVPTSGLISKSYSKKRREQISPERATPSSKIKAGQPQPYESESTTHISVVDGDGQAVSTTQTINQTFGSCVVAEGTGVVLNNEMDDFSMGAGRANGFGLLGSEANAIAARKTMLSSMSPTLVFDSNQKLELILGSPGGPKIITSVLQTILNVVDFQMSLENAVAAPRIHHQWMPDSLVIEDQFSEDIISGLKTLGHTLAPAKAPIGDVQAIQRSDKGGWVGVSDHRSEGEPRGL